jgi:hypothetical protein
MPFATANPNVYQVTDHGVIEIAKMLKADNIIQALIIG